MSPLQSEDCMGPFHVRSKVFIAPIHVGIKLAEFAPHMDGRNADFDPHMEWRHRFRDNFFCCKIADSTNLLQEFLKPIIIKDIYGPYNYF